MQKVNPLQGKLRNVVFFLITLLIVVVDQLSKMWIRNYLPEGHSLPVTGFFQLTHVQNTGGAFGLFQGHTLPLTVVAFVGAVVILVYALIFYPRFPFFDNLVGKSALGLILGGTIGNLIDRMHFGYVTDFFDFGFWPAFNVADSSVVIGVFIFAYSLHSLAGTVKGRG